MYNLGKVVVYDLEIKKPIEQLSRGWQSHDEMGISVLGLYDYSTGRYRCFDENNLAEGIQVLSDCDLVVGYNTVAFDWPVVNATAVNLGIGGGLSRRSVDFDILREIRNNSMGQTGFKLDDVAGDTLGLRKSGHGAFAPVLWQEGKYGELYDYCLEDVRITKELFEFVMKYGYVVRSGRVITIPKPQLIGALQ